MKTFVICLVGICLLLADPARADPSRAQLQQGIEAYNAAFETTDRDQRLRLFRRAEVLFDQVAMNEQSQNANLYANLGNAALGAQRIGPAILAFQRALAIDSKHHLARQNLEHARTLLPDWVPQPDASPQGIGSLLSSFVNRSSQQFQQLASIVFLAAAILLAVSIRWRRTSFRNGGLIMAVFWIGLIAVALLRTNQESEAMAVVILPDTIARSADSINSPARLPEPLPSGVEVRIVEDRKDWLRVRLFDGRDAWLPQSSVERVKT